MDTLLAAFEKMIEEGAVRIIISNPASKEEEYKKLVIEKKKNDYQISKFTEKQVFHENMDNKKVVFRAAELTDGHFRQINGMTTLHEHIVLISKKGAVNYKLKSIKPDAKKLTKESYLHNRRKNYLLEEGKLIPPLVDMGVFTKEGRVVSSMQDKYRQINRFIEIIDDELKGFEGRELNCIDFGCGKSYLTFVVYYYLTQVRHIKTHMVGLDLKADVIEKCNKAAKKYGYEGLVFELGDINGYKADFDVDMVLTLHACDTATDYALYNAVLWKARVIFSVPCCQHELNSQISAKNLSILERYGIIKERFSALSTDAIRGNLLEACGYKTQLLEFVDLEHTPKNILIRAVRRNKTSDEHKQKMLLEVENMILEFGFDQTLYSLLKEDKII